ncbi:MAG: translation factor GTPase family protein [Eubacteriales bacterium]|nr:TetM/TetW/TetO/TetS family tetracycline resistance ribosomal protection protein [Clostridiales bacterium]MDY5709525.1 translation factor GTPase family protein [Eubacteriales bacterium]
MKRLTIGILAHVDSGKTTLSEGLLYGAGMLRKLGRVDHGDAFLDTHALEKSRGITIFSKQARLLYGDCEFTLLDTPGHVDFSAEAERTLSVLDYALLVVSGSEGIQPHTETLFKLLCRYGVPTFVFINKMDISHLSRQELMGGLKMLGEGFIDFSDDVPKEEFYDGLAMCSEDMMEQYLDTGTVPADTIRQSIRQRQVFPCFFGSALKLEGIKELLAGLEEYTTEPHRGDEFGARIFKISDDPQGARLTHMKITSGCLKVKDVLHGSGWAEKADQIRIYSGAKYQTVDQAPAGMVCAVTGLTSAHPGDGLGAEAGAPSPVLEPVLAYRAVLPEGVDAHKALSALRKLEDADPALHVAWNEGLQEIRVQLMGEVQLEIIQSLLKERFGLDIGFDQGGILYKETITSTVEGVGHYEPLRHYAEVHLLLQPLDAGGGLVFSTGCKEDELDKNWQRLILTHLKEKTHLGVLTGSPITDMSITLVAGKAHLKHTEGGDFRQATYRALRQGLMQAESRLLEPWYSFSLQVPQECVGRAMNDLQAMGASFDPPEQRQEDAVISGTAPVIKLQGYPAVLTGYTKGRGRLSCEGARYLPCHNSDEVIAAIGYDPESDTDNPADSVFCSHGAGHTVKWNAVFDNMHIPAVLRPKSEPEHEHAAPILSRSDEEELIRIYERTYGPIRSNPIAAFRPSVSVQSQGFRLPEAAETGPEYLLVDGYNIIFAWDDLAAIAKEDMDLARSRLVNLMCNYRGLHRCEIILVFDAYRIKGNTGSVETVNNISVVYTKEAETADSYIERTTHELSKNYRVQVATSDRMEQLIIIGNGAMRISADAFRKEVDRTEAAMRELMAEKANGGQKLMEGKISRDNKAE